MPESSTNIAVRDVVKLTVGLAAFVGSLGTLWFYQPFALASDVKVLSGEVDAIRTKVAMASDVEELKQSVEMVMYRVELSDVKSEIREISRNPIEQRSAYTRERLVDLEAQRRQLERALAGG